MASETVDPLRDAIQAFNEEGIDAALEYFDPDLEWWSPPEWLEDPLYKGHEGIRKLATFWAQHFDDYRVEPSEFIDLGGNRVMALVHQHGRIKGSGGPVEQLVGYIAEVRDGKVTKVQVWFSWEETRKAAGLQA